MNPVRHASTSINQELLRTFLAAADAKNFSGAARTRHVSKSAISQQVKTLESQLGVMLFERCGRSVRLTPSGRELSSVLRTEFAAIDDAIDALVQDHGCVRGDIRIGSPAAFARVWLRPRLAALVGAYPDLRIHAVFGVPTTLERMLLDRELDFAILVRSAVSPVVESTTVFRERFSPYASPKYLRRRGTPSTVESFAEHRWIVFDGDLPMHAVWWAHRFGSATMRGQVVCNVANLDEMLALVEEGVGMSVLPDYFVRAALDRRTIVEVGGAHKTPATNDISLAWRSNAVQSARFRAARETLLAGPPNENARS